MFKGSCLCRGVNYEVDAFTKAPTHCHCNMCQKISGAAFGTYGRVAPGGFRITTGQDLVREYAATEDYVRSFCSVCGSTLLFAPKNGDHVSVAMGTLDDDPGMKAQQHIFIESQAAWVEVDDDLPKVEGYGS